MTSAAPKLILAKQLKEHLQEEQEPFNLSMYLSERRYMLKKSISDGGSTCSILKSTKNQELYGNKKRSLQNQRNLKSMLYKLIAPDTDRQFSTCHEDVKDQLITETIDMIQQIAETNWFSTVSEGSEFSASPGSSVPQNSPASEHDKELVIAGTLQALNLTF